MYKVILLCAVLFFASAHAWDEPCDEWTRHWCAFRFAGYSSADFPPSFSIGGTPDKPISPKIFLGDKRVESANSQTFDFVNGDDERECGSENFEDHQFYVTQNRVQFSTFNRNPSSEAEDRCVIIPLSSYKLEGSNINCNYGKGVDTEDGCVNKHKACVVFGTKC